MTALAGETCGQVGGFALDKSHETGGEGREWNRIPAHVRVAADGAVNSVNHSRKVRRSNVLPDASRAAPTFVGRLTITEHLAHNLAEQLTDRFADSEIAVSIVETGKGTCALAVYFRRSRDREKLRAAIGAAAGRQAARALRFSRLNAADWVGESLQGLAPVEAGRFVVHGGHDRGRVPINRIGIEIEAALAFGSGHHGTTRGCLLAFDRMCKSLHKPRAFARLKRTKARILDIGTGSGVLAIAAARALRRHIIATDIDPEAIAVARTNVRLNRAAALVRIEKANGVSATLSSARGFQIIFANILLQPLLRLASPLRRRIAPGGRIVLSGMLRAQANAVIAAYRPLALESRIELDEWVTLVLARRRLARTHFRRSRPRARP
jgi:ribosomal protein L11 methyltransferase